MMTQPHLALQRKRRSKTSLLVLLVLDYCSLYTKALNMPFRSQKMARPVDLKIPLQRRKFMNRTACGIVAIITLFPSISNAYAIQNSRFSSSAMLATAQDESTTGLSSIAYKAFSVPIPNFPNTNVPVACWFPVDDAAAATSTRAVYEHRISVRRIGQLLPNWDFIPSFVAKDFSLLPTGSVVDGRGMTIPSGKPTLLLAHGFLGSRFDLSHLAEDLASRGYVCIAAEYPESLAASYERQPDLDRRVINQELLKTLRDTMGVTGRSYGVIGHSLGCGTVAQVGDASWARVSIAGGPRTKDGAPENELQIASLNDGLLRMRNGSAKDYADADYTLIPPGNEDKKRLPRRAAFVLDAPNHISFLCEGVNDAMIGFLSPLLPVAKLLNIPVLDFDRYQESRDSKATAAAVFPVIRQYLQQEMK